MPTTYAIPDGRTVMAATLYTGNGSTQSISNAVNGVSFQPDFVWAKSRSTADANFVLDSVRGATINLYTNGTAAEFTQNTVTAFNSGGFSVGSQANGVNTNAATYIGWQWKAGGTAVSNTSGILASQVSANTTAGFSVCTYTAPASSQANSFGHGLGVAPSMVIAKNRSSGTGGLGWAVYHSSLGANQVLSLNTTAASATVSGYWGSGMTSTVVGLPTGASSTGFDNCTGNMVAYCFAPVAGYSAFGSYTGNGSADGPFIYTGFRPRFILGKASSGTNASTSNWFMMDSARNTYNVANLRLFANLSNADNTQDILDFTSNGFKLRTTNTAENTSGTTYIYMAFAENPFKYANAR
jgi:hypothetical protein